MKTYRTFDTNKIDIGDSIEILHIVNRGDNITTTFKHEKTGDIYFSATYSVLYLGDINNLIRIETNSILNVELF